MRFVSGAKKVLDISGVKLSNNSSFVLFGGINVLESRDLVMSVAECSLK